jgi:hypothetical protein
LIRSAWDLPENMTRPNNKIESPANNFLGKVTDADGSDLT